MRRSVEDIVLLLADEGDRTPDACAQALGVTTRTIRTYVKDANEALEGTARIERVDGTYRLIAVDRQAFNLWLVKAREPLRGLSSRDVSHRVNYLLNDLLSRTGWITIEELSRMLYVSSRTVSQELKDVEQILGAHGLVLEKRPHYGIRVSGDEMDRRTCLASVALQWIEDNDEKGQESGPSESSLVGSRLNLSAIAQCVEGVLRENGFQIASIAYQNLLVHIAVALLRIRDGQYVPMAEESLNAIEGTLAYEVAFRIADALTEMTGVSLPSEEICYIAIHLEGKRLSDGEGAGDGKVVISDSIWDIVSEMLDRVDQVFKFDFRGDLELRVNLAKHVAPLMARLRYDMDLRNPLLSDIRSKFPLAYAMAAECATVLTEHSGTVPSEDEIGYIALSLALAIERKRADMPRKNIMIVCASGAGSARLLEYRCRQEFGAYLGEVRTCDVSQVSELDYSRIDYVFTTVPLPVEVPVPVREVSVFLDTNDVEGVRDLLRTPESADSLLGSFSSSLFFAHAGFATREEAIEYLSDRLSSLDGIEEDLATLVFEREQMAPTSFGNNVAMPHPMRNVGNSTRVAVAVLDNDVPWSEDQKVRLIFLISPARDAGLSLQGFFEAMADLLMDKEAMRLLIEKPAYSTLGECIARLGKGRNR